MQSRPHRYRTEFPTVFSTPTGNVKAVINDVNETGALVSISQPLQRGHKIRVSFLNNHIDAIVQWSLRGKCGISFRPPTDHRASRYAAV